MHKRKNYGFPTECQSLQNKRQKINPEINNKQSKVKTELDNKPD
jgi:hypothetical protein